MYSQDNIYRVDSEGCYLFYSQTYPEFFPRSFSNLKSGVSFVLNFKDYILSECRRPMALELYGRPKLSYSLALEYLRSFSNNDAKKEEGLYKDAVLEVYRYFLADSIVVLSKMFFNNEENKPDFHLTIPKIIAVSNDEVVELTFVKSKDYKKAKSCPFWRIDSDSLFRLESKCKDSPSFLESIVRTFCDQWGRHLDSKVDLIALQKIALSGGRNARIALKIFLYMYIYNLGLGYTLDTYKEEGF